MRLLAKIRAWKAKVPVSVWEFFRFDKAFRWDRIRNEISKPFLVLTRFIAAWVLGAVLFQKPSPGSFYKIMHQNSTMLALPSAQGANWSLEASWVVLVWEFVWQIVGGFCQFFLSAHMLTVIPDLISLVIASLSLNQSKYYIPSNHTCKLNVSSWQTNPNGMNLFTAISQVKNQTANRVCYDFVTIHNTQIAMVAVLATLIATAFSSLLPEAHPLNIYRLLAVIFFAIATAFKEIIIPISLFVHYIGVRLSEKRTKSEIPKPSDQEMIELFRLIKPLPQREYKSQPELMLRVLGIEHLLKEVCLNLCYRDVIRLSRTSRAIHDLVYPPRDLRIRIRKFRAWTCSDDQTTQGFCFLCRRRICDQCQMSSEVQKSQQLHIHKTKGCRPSCTWCYYKNIIRNRQRARTPCPQTHVAVTAGSNKIGICCICYDDARANTNDESWDLTANVKSRFEALAHIDAREKNCKYCGNQFNWLTRRWWLCSICNHECRDAMHPHHLPRPKKEKAQADMS